jgi:hypothetical protein
MAVPGLPAASVTEATRVVVAAAAELWDLDFPLERQVAVARQRARAPPAGFIA